MFGDIQKIPRIKYHDEIKFEYEGCSVNGCPEGQGTQVLGLQGKTLTGIFRNGQLSNGEILFEDGSSYEGRFSNNIPQLIGKYTSKEKIVYESIFKMDFKHYKQRSIKYPGGDSIIGKWRFNWGIHKGVLTQILPSGLIKRFEIKDSYQEIEENLELANIYFHLGIKSYKILNSKTKLSKVIYKNGDILNGIIIRMERSSISFIGSITYSDNRHPDFNGKVSNNYPVSGKGTFVALRSGILYQGNFDIGGTHTATERDGTHHLISIIEKKKISRLTTYPNGKTFQGHFKSRSLNAFPTDGEGVLRHVKNRIEVEGVVKNGIFKNCKVTDHSMSTTYFLEYYDRNCVFSYKKNKSIRIEYSDGISTSIEFDKEQISRIRGNRISHPDSKNILYISKTIPPPNEMSSYEVEGIRQSKDNGMDVLEVGKFIFSSNGLFKFYEGILINKSGQVEIQAKKSKKRLKITIQKNFKGEVTINRKIVAHDSKKAYSYVCKNMNSLKPTKLGWNREIRQKFEIFEGEFDHNLMYGNGLIVFKEQQQELGECIMVFMKGNYSIDVCRFESFMSKYGERKKTLVLKGDNSLEYLGGN